MNKLSNLTDKFKNKQVIVWGDFILDEYIFTTTGRVSREAPVLVTELQSRTYKAGGAGNVVMNIKALGAHPIPVGFTGNNQDGQILKDIFEKNGITSKYLFGWGNYLTPKKSRILSGSENTKKQQVLRIDTLNKSEIEPQYHQKTESILLNLLASSDALIISDYLYESVHPAILEKIRHKHPEKIVIIDSRYNLMNFKTVSYATPNELELKRMFPNKRFLDDQDFFEAGKELMELLDARGIVLKRGHKGMTIFERGQKPKQIDIHGSSEIVDVTGAGDTVISVLSLSLVGGIDFFDSAQIANLAAGLVVMKEGAYPINIKELQHELQ